MCVRMHMCLVWTLWICLPTEPEYDTRSFYCGEPCTNRNSFAAGPKNTYPCRHSPIKASETPSNKTSSAKHVNPEGAVPGDKVFNS